MTYTVEGQEVRQGTVNATFAGLSEGGTIELLYDPQQSERMQANRFISLWGWAFFFGVCGLVDSFRYFLFPKMVTRPPQDF